MSRSRGGSVDSRASFDGLKSGGCSYREVLVERMDGYTALEGSRIVSDGWMRGRTLALSSLRDGIQASIVEVANSELRPSGITTVPPSHSYSYFGSILEETILSLPHRCQNGGCAGLVLDWAL